MKNSPPPDEPPPASSEPDRDEARIARLTALLDIAKDPSQQAAILRAAGDVAAPEADDSDERQP
jgi:hypothetical protein